MQNDLLRLKPDVVFNLVESLAEADSLVYLPHADLDVLGIPYAGNRTESLFLTTHKLLAKERLRSDGLPTPAWIDCLHEEDGGTDFVHEAHEGQGAEPWKSTCKHSTEEDVPALLSHSFRPSSCPSWQIERTSWIIKGVWHQASRGMDDDAVLREVGADEVRLRLQQRVVRSGSPCFAEQFIEGREFNLSVLTGPNGPEVLPPAEIDFSAFPPGKPRIVGHRAKWQEDSFEYQNTPRRFVAPDVEGPLVSQLQAIARQCWTLFRLRGWARVDFRVDEAGQPWVLEINANPCLSPDAGFAAALERAGIPFDEAIGRILAETSPK
jgi:D-alanine-D-alanine ligase